MTGLVECTPLKHTGEVRRFRVPTANVVALEACCIVAHPGDRKHAPRPPAVEIRTSPAGCPITSTDPAEVRALGAVLAEAARWLEAELRVADEHAAGQLSLDDVTPHDSRPVADVAPTEEVA